MEDNKPHTFAERLRTALDLRGVSQAELSRKTKISKSSLSHYLKGDWEGKQDAVYTIALALNVDEAWLMGYDTEMDRVDYKELIADYEKIEEQMRKMADEFGEGVFSIGPEDKTILFKDHPASKEVSHEETLLLVTLYTLNSAKKGYAIRTLRILSELISVMSPEDQDKLVSYAEFMEADRQKRLGISVQHRYQCEQE